MAGSWTTERFPQYERSLRKLIDQHREIEDEPLHLAISYQPPRDPHDVFLFEVIGDSIDGIRTDRDLFEVTFEPTAQLPLASGERMHLVLTNPREFRQALDENWPLANELRDAIRSHDYKVLHSDTNGEAILNLMREPVGG